MHNCIPIGKHKLVRHASVSNTYPCQMSVHRLVCHTFGFPISISGPAPSVLETCDLACLLSFASLLVPQGALAVMMRRGRQAF